MGEHKEHALVIRLILEEGESSCAALDDMNDRTNSIRLSAHLTSIQHFVKVRPSQVGAEEVAGGEIFANYSLKTASRLWPFGSITKAAKYPDS